ncbi:hypothetical protein GSI_08821 [Ganoderma sinense ZZ0214-1]|uniref:DUF8212 domain-containing protein n=1 Tax=Ganoderma sinense ZZ0214-1 TaxID=1077348 RepID=A0A2G8S4X2_9APHY|nr:hypothetical protein GSI_08821 [Ganoderma sinense ZZ0214-1]
MERPRHLLGRVCYIPPSESGVDFVYSGYIDFDSTKSGAPAPDLFPLSPEIIEHESPHIELKTVYISHPKPDRTNSYPPWSIRGQPYTAIKLVLLRDTRNALRSRGYSINLRDPIPDHPTAHRLMLSKDEHTITVEFQHVLSDGGKRFTINATVKLSGSRSGVQFDSAQPGPCSRLYHRAVSWTDGNWEGWDIVLKAQRV